MWNKGVAQFMQLHLLTRKLQLLSSSTQTLEGVCQRLVTGTAPLFLKSFFSTCNLHKMEPNSPKKIQFAVPLFQSQLDPEAAEQIRKRRPTPASLVILNDHSSPEIDEKRMTSTHEENVSPKQRKESVYTAPSMTGVKQIKSQNDSSFPEEEEGENEGEEECDH
ncbi:protein phosphatase 1 regulatory subunit 1C isoform X2 [Ascaphus truei]|uniref:protein phosphatase 1 regulatory subunit 1C isoform X2 n=1 Tax=Ascaphus truei TaxID=8439 RepID=UPI003F595270